MDYRQLLQDELERLNRLNSKYEKRILANKYDDEPDLIVKNVLAMCEIADILKI